MGTHLCTPAPAPPECVHVSEPTLRHRDASSLFGVFREGPSFPLAWEFPGEPLSRHRSACALTAARFFLLQRWDCSSFTLAPTASVLHPQPCVAHGIGSLSRDSDPRRGTSVSCHPVGRFAPCVPRLVPAWSVCFMLTLRDFVLPLPLCM